MPGYLGVRWTPAATNARRDSGVRDAWLCVRDGHACMHACSMQARGGMHGRQVGRVMYVAYYGCMGATWVHPGCNIPRLLNPRGGASVSSHVSMTMIYVAWRVVRKPWPTPTLLTNPGVSGCCEPSHHALRVYGIVLRCVDRYASRQGMVQHDMHGCVGRKG